MDLYFAPDQDCKTPLLKAIDSAQESILVADYSFSMPELTTALIAKKNAGVKVRLLLDRTQSFGKSESPEISKLKAAGVDYLIGTSDKHRIMHLKVSVIDDETIVFGSFNFTQAATLENNVVCIYEDADDAQLFSEAIEKAYQWVLTNQPQGLQLKSKGTLMTTQDKTLHVLLTLVTAFLSSWALTGNALTKDALIGALAATFVGLVHLGAPAAKSLKARL